MTKIIRLIAVMTALLAIPFAAVAQTVTFADAAVGSLPKEFEPALTGSGKPGQWEVVADPQASGGKALAQLSGDPTSYRFPLAIYKPTLPSDVEVTVSFKAISGEVDQAGGLAVRLVDAQNYYIARANALEGNVRFYRVVGGERQQIASAQRRVTANEWHDLTIRAKGDQFTVVFNGEELFTETDQTFTGSGKVALWTKADSITRFNRIVIAVLK
jgi:hypothetical protein